MTYNIVYDAHEPKYRRATRFHSQRREADAAICII